MAEFKVVVSDSKKGKSYSFEAKEDAAEKLLGLKIGSKFDGSLIGLDGYELEITGGSDASGFPMKKSLEGTSRKKIIIPKGFGLRKVRNDIRRRKTFAGNTVFEDTAQINTSVAKHGKKPLGEENDQKEAGE
ncbi:MAG TPA: 30S ribosomal protein S6e [Candidatus Woesearchaeota archaeon]|nr:30S ribosomal protein S6e [Candidatus Woesearchaeota archaeon]